jgi:hypothetical protein
MVGLIRSLNSSIPQTSIQVRLTKLSQLTTPGQPLNLLTLSLVLRVQQVPKACRENRDFLER